MAAILVDYENVSGKNGLHGLEFLCEKDILYIFYSNSCEKIRADQMRLIDKSGCQFKAIKLLHSRSNALDFYIATECGSLLQSGEKQIAVVSGDKGFHSIADYFSIRPEAENAMVNIAPTIDQALLYLNAKEDHERRKMIRESMMELDLNVEFARMEERNAFRKAIINAFEGTKYQERSGEILDYIEHNREKTGRALYTNTLHNFGRVSGTEIYQILKKVV